VKKLKDKPFALVGVHVGGSTVKQLAATMEKEKLPWRSFVDLGNAGTGPISVKWNFPAPPTFYLIDHKGIIRHKWTGAPGEKVMDAALEKLIEAAEKDGKEKPR
jgi:peroxiredoxin